EAWEKAHAMQTQKKIEMGQKGHAKAEGASKFRYKVLDVKEGTSFSILWKTLFVRLIFTHRVKPIKMGSEIRYDVQIKGPFAWIVRWMLGAKIKSNVSLVLKAIVKQLENESAAKSHDGRGS
ncbi:MAG: hypothetical protein V4487_00150, partial [Chlamydiota bacterium]